MSGARKRRSDGVSWPVVLSLLRFNICTFSFLVVVSNPQPNCVGRVCHLEKWFPPRGADMTLTAGLFLFAASSPVKKANNRGMLLCLPMQVSYRPSLRVSYVAWGPGQRQCGQSVLWGYMSGTSDSVSGELNYRVHIGGIGNYTQAPYRYSKRSSRPGYPSQHSLSTGVEPIHRARVTRCNTHATTINV